MQLVARNRDTKCSFGSVSECRMASAMFTTGPNVINKVYESSSLSPLLQTGSVSSQPKLNRH